MSYGRFSPEQKSVVKRFVARRVVHDLGAGDLKLAHELLSLRAASVVAVDKCLPIGQVPGNMTFVEVPFRQYAAPVRTAFVSWPWADDSGGLDLILKTARTVIYLGSNLDGSACGDRHLWAHLTKRVVLAHVPHRMNTLIVYGKSCGVRDVLPEEDAGLNVTKMRYFTDVYGAA